MAFRCTSWGFPAISFAYPAASAGNGAAEFRDKGVAPEDECRSFYPVFLPKPGLRYQPGPAKAFSGKRQTMMQHETTAAIEAIADCLSYHQLSQTHSTGSIRRRLSPVNPVATPFKQR